MSNLITSCVRRDHTSLSFHPEFLMWAIVMTFAAPDDRYELTMLCNGWEL